MRRREGKQIRIVSVLAAETLNTQMQLKESIQNTKKLFHKTLHSLKSLFVGGYEKLPKPNYLNPFSCVTTKVRSNKADEYYYSQFCNEWECDLEQAMKRKNALIPKEPSREDVCRPGSPPKPAKSPVKKKQVEAKESKKKSSSTHCRKEEGGYPLAQKMKDLDMMDANDVEHALDVEEALHYYSRLKSPVYLDIVDKFFTDMYTEFSVPKATASINNSKRRLGSIRL